MHDYDEKLIAKVKKISVDDVIDQLYTLSAWCEAHGLPSISNNLLASCSNIEDRDEMELLAHASRPYKVEGYEKFAKECEAGGFTVVHYNGRGEYSGPAVMSDDVWCTQDIIRTTSVQVNVESMGLGSIVYPYLGG
jgi:hypothetical protein